MILRSFYGASVAVVLYNSNALAVVVDFALLGDHGKLCGANEGSTLRSYHIYGPYDMTISDVI